MEQQTLFRLCFLFGMIIVLFYTIRSYSPTVRSISIAGCSKSLVESDNLICESDRLWNQRKTIYRFQDQLNMKKLPNSLFFLTNWQPNFHCAYTRRIGRMGDGGKWVCDFFRLQTRTDCLVYSAGSNGEFSFEIGMKQYAPNCEIHTFDSDVYTCPQNVCTFHQARLGNGDPPEDSKNWPMILDELGHRNRSIDVLKIDIEGGEFAFLSTIFKLPKKHHPRQILVEIHPQPFNVMHGLFELLRTNDYVIFYREPNLIAGPTLYEYAFLKLNPLFFQTNVTI